MSIRKRAFEERKSIQNHYNKQQNESGFKRRKSKMYRLRSLNNWIKSVLLDQYLEYQGDVLDLCCGKGGDLQKYRSLKIQSLVAVDFAPKSIENAVSRYNKMNPQFSAKFGVGDCFESGLLSFLEDGVCFDLVSCQFSLHYACDTQKRLESLFENASCRLKRGGYFVATIPDADLIIQKLKEIEGWKFGNNKYQIEFMKNEKIPNDKSFFPAFGTKYKFKLDEAVFDLPESLVHPPTLAKIARKYGFKPILKKNFHDIFNKFRKVKKYQELFKRLKCLNQKGGVDIEDWEIMGLYLGVAFKKIKATPHYNPEKLVRIPRCFPYTHENIVKVVKNTNENENNEQVVQLENEKQIVNEKKETKEIQRIESTQENQKNEIEKEN
ncbi:mRNA cap guanine-n7 methyltransferase [Anaeramoeba flamelloides]|uniref:mRNA (guanine-N(7))-methyltransferase n=1 Tax=Anaeramoeba flamelloides TaxID=1746091 RepID=A0AAV7ZZF4_9EUKA|nr:mRNA cap guanine-n7 methyltransferase [Anaeramoeba flamelloides]